MRKQEKMKENERKQEISKSKLIFLKNSVDFMRSLCYYIQADRWDSVSFAVFTKITEEQYYVNIYGKTC